MKRNYRQIIITSSKHNEILKKNYLRRSISILEKTIN